MALSPTWQQWQPIRSFGTGRIVLTLAAAAALGSLAVIIAAAVGLAPHLPRPIGNDALAYQTWGAGPVTGAALLYLVFAVTVVNGGLRVRCPICLCSTPWNSSASAAVLAASLYWLVRTRPLIPAGQRSTFWLLRWVWGAVLLYILSLLSWSGPYTSWPASPFHL